MANHRYHIHVIGGAHEQPMVLDSLAICFQGTAFLTHDAIVKSTQASLYSRQCVDACDYILAIIGDSYGTAQKNGVSQLHLSYLNARTKLKPMLVLIKSYNKNKKLNRQLRDFIRLVEKQAYDVYYYDETTDISGLLPDLHTKMVEKYGLKPSWAYIHKHSEANEDERLHHSSSEKHPTAKDTTQSLVLSDVIEIRYRAQAYEGGNLTDIKMSIHLSWQQILQALTLISNPFSSYSLQVCINRLIANHAEQDIKKQMPNVHAVSRYQVFHNDLNNLQRALVAANYIQLTACGLKASQELWRLTFYAKKHLSESQSNDHTTSDGS
ncbi:DUF4062 domain-containing protein [Psychrobacter sp. F1192]|uniref:DUF4062 domain-containing protein n=1 Tax=Psychrobacter coccoides TaxID=2818440 RepID=A0ABS3NPQ5_9GAMM|nr:DUF4062 domain-containing protein [Psychrobacter coccoides]